LTANATAFDFKGLKTGVPLEDDRFYCESKKTAVADVQCHVKLSYKETIAGIPALLVATYLIDYKVAIISVSFRSSDFDTVKSAAIEKYGPGTSTFEKLRNKMGAQFENETITWTDSTDVLSISQYAGTIDRGNYTIKSISSIEALKQRKSQQTTNNANDL
jgi:hypothetical protein